MTFYRQESFIILTDSDDDDEPTVIAEYQPSFQEIK